MIDYLNAMLMCDFYKSSHPEQYPKGTELVYSTWTPRASRIEGVTEVVAFGFQAFVKEYLVEFFDRNFFKKEKTLIIEDYRRTMKYCLGLDNPNVSRIEELHELGYLPLTITAVPEGTRVPIRCPMLTISNTDDRFYWLTNYFETLMSTQLWQACTSATIALRYKRLLDKYALETVGDTSFVPYQGHDFSMRGMSSLSSAMLSGAGHLLSFVGTDTIPAIYWLEKFYNADMETELIGTSIPASEHSVQCCFQDDLEYFRSLIQDVYPNGFVSIVSDGYDFWKVITEVVPAMKELIMVRNGKVVIRPDSGDPVKIICGDPDATEECVRKGTVECLWDTFGGTLSPKGYKILDSHIGTIYGDAITVARTEQICEILKSKGFASINVVLGIGSYTYQMNTRDTFGFAVKSTLSRRNGVTFPIFKDPKTDDGTKKSQRGGVDVCVNKDGEIYWMDGLGYGPTTDENGPTHQTIMRTIYHNGYVCVDDNLANVRKRVQG